MRPALTDQIDLAQAALVAFIGLFFALVYYLRREDKREGYPLEDEESGRPPRDGYPMPPRRPKLFRLIEGGTSTNPMRQPQPDALQPEWPYPGSALVPTGDPLVDGVGPASYARRKDEPLRTREGVPQVRPLRLVPDWHVLKGDADPRGMTVVAADGEAVGRVVDLWLDHGVKILRYIEVALSGGEHVMLPIYYADVQARRGRVVVRALAGSRFARMPRLANPDEITAREEDRVNAYYAGGAMYSVGVGVEPPL